MNDLVKFPEYVNQAGILFIEISVVLLFDKWYIYRE